MEIVRASLASRTTLGVGGEAEVAECDSVEDLAAALMHAHEGGLPFWILGEGSNTLALDEGYGGLVIHPRMSGVSFEDDARGGTLLVADAGAHWDALVDAAAARGLWGIENLAGIPGSAGAAAVQNVGAYGAEFAEAVAWVECVDAQAMLADASRAARANGERIRALRLAPADCAFGYRESRFKREPDLIVTRIALRLAKDGRARLEYPDLARAAGAARASARGAAEEPLGTPAAVAAAVRAIRAKKFPDLSREGTAGSFFKNPVIGGAEFEALRARYPELPGFPQRAADAPVAGASAARVKVPLAFILDRVLGLKGYRMRPESGARCFENQPLVLVAERGASARDVDALARAIARSVFDATGIAIEREVVALR